MLTLKGRIEVMYSQSRVQVKLAQRQSRPRRFSTWVNAQQSSHLSTTDYYCLTGMEVQLASEVQKIMAPNFQSGSEKIGLELRKSLRSYQSRARRAYKDNAEQSSFMLLTLMEIWMALDALSITLYPLLSDYDPGFPLDLMHCLKLANLFDMHRLQRIERYLEGRRTSASYSLSNVLGNPTKASFAVRFFDQNQDMQDLYSKIQLANDDAKLRKEQELVIKSAEYENLMRQASATVCLYIEDDFNPLIRHHDHRHCRKHYLERAATRMRIQIHEDLLPAELVNAKAVVFEILLPRGFAAWRDSTWQLLMLARGETTSDRKPMLLLRDFSGFRQFLSG